MRMIDYFLHRKFLVNLIGAFICLFGLFALMDMKRDLIPPFEFEIVRVSASMPGASTLEMERLVTFPIEEGLKGLPGIVKTRSSTSHDSTSITLQYEPGFSEMDKAVELVRARILGLSDRLPIQLKPVQVQQERVTEVFLSIYAIEGFLPNNGVHRDHLLRMQKAIEQVPGVVRTEARAAAREIYIKFDPEKLKLHGVSAAEIRRRLGDGLAYTPVGRLRHNELDLAVEIAQSQTSLEEIASLPIAGNRTGNIVRLRDVARVEFSIGQVHSKSYFAGKEATFLTVFKDTSSDSITLHEKVQKKIDDLNQALPAPLRTTLVFEGPQFIKKQIHVLSTNGLGGLILVVIILMVFLNVRTALMTAWGLPISYLGTIAVLSMLGIAIDLISIVGMILVVGILVDDAIIVSERYIENLTAGLKPVEAARQAAHDLIMPVTGTILTTIVAFLPVMLVKSEIMAILFAVPVVIITSLGLSWFESFYILPNHLAHFVKQPPKEKSEKFFAVFRDRYTRGLEHILKWRYLYTPVIFAFAAFSFYVAGTKLKHDFNLSIGSERLDVFLTLKQSDSLDQTAEKLKPIYSFIESLDIKGIGSLDTDVGSVWRDGRRYEGFRFAKLRIWLDPQHPFPRELKAELIAKIEPMLEKIRTEDMELLTVKEAKQGDDESKKNLVSVKVQGGEQIDFAEIEAALAKAAAGQDLIGEWVKPEDRDQEGWEFVANTAQMIRYGLSQADLGAQLKQIFTPHELTQLRIGGESVRLFTQLELEQTPRVDQLASFEILTASGTSVPLSFLGEWRQKRSLKSVEHQNGRRVLTTDFRFDPEKANATTAKASLGKLIEPVKASFPAYDINVTDSNEQDTEAQKWALKVGVYSLLGVLFVLAAVLGSLTQPFLVAAPIPFGVVGIIWALWLHDLPLGLMAMIGLVGTVGVAVNDSLVMTDNINRLTKERGRLNRSTLIEGAASRLRAIFLTTLTTVAGVFPMAYGIGGESGFTQPLAFAMGWGLTFSTLMTLFLLPALLEIREDVNRLGEKLFTKVKSESVAPNKIQTVLDRFERPVRGPDHIL